jgi:hypothetical protein
MEEDNPSLIDGDAIEESIRAISGLRGGSGLASLIQIYDETVRDYVPATAWQNKAKPYGDREVTYKYNWGFSFTDASKFVNGFHKHLWRIFHEEGPPYRDAREIAKPMSPGMIYDIKPGERVVIVEISMVPPSLFPLTDGATRVLAGKERS